MVAMVWEGARFFFFLRTTAFSFQSPDEGIDAVQVHTKSWYSTAVQVK